MDNSPLWHFDEEFCKWNMSNPNLKREILWASKQKNTLTWLTFSIRSDMLILPGETPITKNEADRVSGQTDRGGTHDKKHLGHRYARKHI